MSSGKSADKEEINRLCNLPPAVFYSLSSLGFSPCSLFCCLPLPLLLCTPTRAPLGVGFLLLLAIGLAFTLVAIARRQPAPEHAGCLIDKQTKKRYESEVGESSLAFLLQKFRQVSLFPASLAGSND